MSGNVWSNIRHAQRFTGQYPPWHTPLPTTRELGEQHSKGLLRHVSTTAMSAFASGRDLQKFRSKGEIENENKNNQIVITTYARARDELNPVRCASTCTERYDSR